MPRIKYSYYRKIFMVSILLILFVVSCSMTEEINRNVGSDLLKSNTPEILHTDTISSELTHSTEITPSPEEKTSTVISATPTESEFLFSTKNVEVKFLSDFQDINFQENTSIIFQSLEGRGSGIVYQMDLNSNTEDEIMFSIPNIDSIKESPNHQWLIFRNFVYGEKMVDLLIVKNMLTGEIIERNWQKDAEWNSIVRWLNDGELLIAANSYSKYPPEFIAYNPFSNSVRSLQDDFPDFQSENSDNVYCWPNYDPTGNYVLYPANTYTDSGFEIVLYSYITGTKLNQYPVFSLYDIKGPVWNYSGDSFFIVEKNVNHGSLMFLLGKLDGESSILADMVQEIPSAEIHSKAWSPNDRYIAITIYDYDLDTDSLFIVDLQENEVIKTNIKARSNGNDGAIPVWSPDSTQIIIENYYTDTQNEVILFDVENMEATTIFSDVNVLSWTLFE